MKILGLFTAHPREVGENYFTHALMASKIALKFAVAVPMQLIHAVFPFICPPLGSDTCSVINFLEEMMPENRKKKNPKACCGERQCQSNVS